jgi:hypothetical protein
LFVVAIHDGQVRATSRIVDGDKLAVAVEWDEPVEDIAAVAITSHWTFRYDRDTDPNTIWTTIDGTIRRASSGAVDLNQPERFARDLASLSGWASLGSSAEQLVRVA